MDLVVDSEHTDPGFAVVRRDADDERGAPTTVEALHQGAVAVEADDRAPPVTVAGELWVDLDVEAWLEAPIHDGHRLQDRG